MRLMQFSSNLKLAAVHSTLLSISMEVTNIATLSIILEYYLHTAFCVSDLLQNYENCVFFLHIFLLCK